MDRRNHQQHNSHPQPHHHHHSPSPPPPVVHHHHPTPPPVVHHHTPTPVVTVVHHHETTHHHAHPLVADRASVRVYCKARPDFSLTIRDGHVVLAPSNPADLRQHWVKDEKYSTRVKDDEGFPSFSLINKKTGEALKHAIGATHPVQLIPYNPDRLDESILWTESRDLGDTYRTVRMVNNIRLNVDAFNGDPQHGGVHDGTKIVLWEWKKGPNQRWNMTYYFFNPFLQLTSFQETFHSSPPTSPIFLYLRPLKPPLFVWGEAQEPFQEGYQSGSGKECHPLFISFLHPFESPNPPTVRTLAKQFLSFLNKALSLIPKHLSETSIPNETAITLFDVYNSCLDCFDLISSELVCNPYSVHIQWARYIHCLEARKLYAEAEKEVCSVMESLRTMAGYGRSTAVVVGGGGVDGDGDG